MMVILKTVHTLVTLLFTRFRLGCNACCGGAEEEEDEGRNSKVLNVVAKRSTPADQAESRA